jgi:hypothetical protein
MKMKRKFDTHAIEFPVEKTDDDLQRIVVVAPSRKLTAQWTFDETVSISMVKDEKDV